MTPTDAARQLLDTDHDHPMTRNALMAKYGPAIARALLDAEARIAALEGALRKIMQTSDQCYSEHPAFKAVYNLIYDALTPEGKSNGN